MEQTAPTPAADAQAPSGALNEFTNEINEAVTRYVVVEVNGNLYGMPTDSTVELMSSAMTQITRVPHSPKFVFGVINHRGTIIPVVDMRTLLGFSCQGAEVTRLAEFFSETKRAHTEWLDALEVTVREDQPFTRITDHTKCEFGKWYQSVFSGTNTLCKEVLEIPVIRSFIERFDSPHKKIHRLAQHVLDLKNKGDDEQALELIEKCRAGELATMCRLFDQLIKTVKAQYESMLVITEYGSRKTAIAVDGVSFVTDCRDEEVESLPDTADNTEFLSGLVHQADGTYILIADLENIYSTASPAE